MRFSSSPRCFSGEAVRDERSARGRSERGCAADGRAWRQERRLTPGEGWISSRPRGYRPFVRRRTSVARSSNSDGVSHIEQRREHAVERLLFGDVFEHRPETCSRLRIELHRRLSPHRLSLSHDAAFGTTGLPTLGTTLFLPQHIAVARKPRVGLPRRAALPAAGLRRLRRHQVDDPGRRGPGRGAVVEHDGQHRRQAVGGAECPRCPARWPTRGRVFGAFRRLLRRGKYSILGRGMLHPAIRR